MENERIEELVSFFGISVSAFEKKANLSNAAISAPLRNGTNISRLSAYRISQKMFVDYEWIMGNADRPFKDDANNPYARLFADIYSTGLTLPMFAKEVGLPKNSCSKLLNEMNAQESNEMYTLFYENLKNTAIPPKESFSTKNEDQNCLLGLKIQDIVSLSSGFPFRNIKGTAIDLYDYFPKESFLFTQKDVLGGSTLAICEGLCLRDLPNLEINPLNHFIIITSPGDDIFQVSITSIIDGVVHMIEDGVGDELSYNLTDILGIAKVVGYIKLF